jgi:hypothetical protein
MTNELPIVCTLTPEALAARKAGLLPGLVRQALAVESIADSMRLTFSPEAVMAIASTIDGERRCCRFLRFEVTLEPDEGPVRLTITGPPGTGEFLAALIEA